METVIPNNWELAKLDDISSQVKEKVNPLEIVEAIYLGLEHIKSNGGLIGEGSSKDVKSIKTKFKKGDVLYGKLRPYLNKHVIADTDGICSTDIVGFRPFNEVVGKYLNYYIGTNDFVTRANQASSGINLPRVSANVLSKFEIALPPLAEQKRIVAKLDTLFASLENTKTRLEKIPTLLKNFKQAILTQAVTGKLTEQWREGKELESGLDLISKNRAISYEEKVRLAKELGERKPKKLDESDFEYFSYDEEIDYPKSWDLGNLKNIADLITDGEHSTPRRTDEGFYLLSARNVQNGFISLDKVDYVPEEEYLRLRKRCNPEFKDVLISCSGTVGRVSVVPKDLDFVMVRSAALVKLQWNSNSSKYIEFALRSRLVQDQMLKLQKSTAQANLFIGPIGKIVVPIPSIQEQTEIVRRVESLFANADAIEQQYQSLKKKVDTLPQAILAKAFRGELVEQNPLDEPASVLLEKIKSLREAEGKVKPKRKTVRKKKSLAPVDL